MLVLTRKEGQRVVLSNGVTIEIKQIRGRCIKIGVDAPKNVKILREEVLEKDKVEKE